MQDHRYYVRTVSLAVFVILGSTSFVLAKKVPKYQVGIDSKPSGALVYVDGKKIGVAAPDFRTKLLRGMHKISLDLGDDYQPYNDNFNVTGDMDISVPMQPKPAMVSVVLTTSDPALKGPLTAELLVNKESKGTITQASQIQLTEGTYLIEFVKPGYQTYWEKITVTKPNQKGISIFAKLEPEAKTPTQLVPTPEVKKETVLQVVIPASDQSALGATLYIDGLPVIQGIRAGDSVPVQPGPHRIEALKEGFQPFVQMVTFPASTNQLVEVKLVKVVEPIKPVEPTIQRTGDLLVISDQPNAEVLVDASKRYKIGEIIPRLTPGQHSIQVSAPGYKTFTKVVDVKAGEQTAEKVTLEADVVKKSPRVRLVLTFPAEGAQFYINGKRYTEEQVTNDNGVEVPSGPTTVLVKKEGAGLFNTSFNLPDQPQRRDIVVDLKNRGTLELAADPAPVDIFIDKAKVGSTTANAPLFEKELPVGKYLVEVKKPGGYQDSKQEVTIETGKTAKIYVSLIKPEVPTPKLDPVQVRMGATSFSAKTLEPGYWNLDLGGGYPYFADLRINAGIFRKEMLGLDGGFEVRTFGYLTEAAATLRFQFIHKGAFAMGTNLLLGGGAGPDGRNTVVFEAGLPLSLVLSNRFTFTAHPYFQVYSDDLRVRADESPIQEGRMTNWRLLLRGVFEIGLTPRINLYLLVEGEPTRRERPAFSSQYIKIMAVADPFIYGRIGVSFKF